MVVICEPSCKYFSHEKINEGFINKTRLAFPNEKIIFLGHKSHIEVLQNNLVNSKIEIGNIQFNKIKINTNQSAFGLLTNYRILRKINRIIINNDQSKLLFLSHPKTILFIFKYFNYKINTNKIFIQHGEFESILDPIKPKFKLFDLPQESTFSRIRKVSFTSLKKYSSKFLIKLDPFYWFLKKVSYRKLLEKNNSNSFRYILISEHIKKNVSKIINLKKYNFHVVNYPQVQKKNFIHSNNEFPKFAIFGYGDSRMLFNLNVKIKKLIKKEKFEIRIIGMDNRGIKDFSWVNCPKKGKTLTRVEMERLIVDIDYFLILYTNDKYRLSCSASIIEAISYGKPIIHLKNDCISHFNEGNKIGYEETSLESIAKRILNISLNFNIELEKINFFKENIKIKSELISPKNQLEEFRKTFN